MAASAGAPLEGTRSKLVRTTSRLMQRQGYQATGVKQITREAGVSHGSMYHFFPGGKDELAVAAVRHAEAEFAEMLETALAALPDPADAIELVTARLGEYLQRSEWTDGCPITATALETAGRVPEIEKAVSAAFSTWRELVAVKLIGAGFAEGSAVDLAWTVINTLEGAELAAQVERSIEPLRLAGRHLRLLVDACRP
ncbi:TetR/AcrR family transcriptional regulator [Amycolatopsis sp. cmx-11-12]|uniref:TetR/AcrR family transcriptional regulator n=1 Tax=Amycolatopsis sp. cmx-11-12 TaxID=2785795 RepID=UPI003917B947